MTTDPALVLVVGRSRINTVVVSRIVERSGLHPITEQPEDAARSLAAIKPALVILDGGAANADCDALVSPLSRMRQAAGRMKPAVILLSTGNFDDIGPAHAAVIDAVVSKPILPEVLQPVVDKLLSNADA
ncbi:response regulator [Pseudaminobacter sp. 19-2017]|uniref:Response regulator n=1 Tax=Pseudaminobacter soli (ex Zhang et al. 2022) TaxID=2831468 RepID=A0A942I2A5_9HYPH|nr:response regulator [Pseudaminobacter soli]